MINLLTLSEGSRSAEGLTHLQQFETPMEVPSEEATNGEGRNLHYSSD